MKALKISYSSLVYSFLYLPIIVLIIYSFNASKFGTSWKGFTFKWYESLMNNSSLMSAAGNSLLVAVTAATFATIIGSVAAVAFYRYGFKGKKMLLGLVYVLIMAPDIVMGISLLIMFVTIHMNIGFTTLLLSHITFNIPFVIVTVLSRMKGFDKNLFDAAGDLGATEFQTVRYVLLPMMFPAVIAGWLLSFTLSMDDVLISFFVTGPDFDILPLRIYSMVRLGVKPEVNALCTVMFALSLIIVMASQILNKEKK
ncbi:MAG: spermidine/putrescine ABC transporter permease PotC [Deferribacterales bacterium]